MVSRRDFFVAVGAVAVVDVLKPLATAVVTPIGEDIGAYVRDSTKRFFDSYDYDVDAIKTVFGSIDTGSSFIPGQSHPRYRGFHPDDEYVADRFDDLVKDTVENRVVYDSKRIPQNLRGTAIVSGSPVSNAVARYVLEYSYVDRNNPIDGLLRSEKPVFETEFEFVLAKNALNEMGIMEPVGRRGISQNWSIVNRRTSELYAAENRDGRIRSDYLLVTRLPHIFDKDSFKKDEGIFLLAGGHGVGTKAIDLLLQDTSLLSRLSQKVGESKYWQALFQIEGVDHYHEDPKFGTH